MNYYLISALSLGFLGSFHCLGMCGPIALSLPVVDGDARHFYLGRLMYQLGRVTMYMLLGVIAGLIGISFQLKGLQSDLSIFSGILIILVVLFLNDKLLSKVNGRLVKMSFRIKSVIGNYIKKKSFTAMYVVGLANGILPCGFVYLAMAGAISFGGITNAALYMFLFGLGTLPLMYIVAVSQNIFSPKVKLSINKLSPFIAIALALFLIHRGSTMKSVDGDCCKHERHNVQATCK
jgi:sulfite exporter TauE/SafE